MRIARDLCKQISDGELAVGSAVPSKDQLRETYGVAGATARRAVEHLQSRGVLEGYPGRGVFVRRLPVPDDLGPEPTPALGDQVEDQGHRLAHLEANLRELYRRLDQEYPEPS